MKNLLSLMLLILIPLTSIASDYAGSVRASGDASHAKSILWYDTKADNRLLPGALVETKMDFSSGMAGASFAVYGVARGVGKAGTWGVHDIVGVHGSAYKDFNGWASGIHADVYDSVPGGTAIGVNIEFPRTQSQTATIGLNIQPSISSRGIIGIQLQNPETYRYGILAPNTNWVFGMVGGTPFGMRFNSATQRLEFFRNIGASTEDRKGFIDMSEFAKDAQLNR